MVYQAPATFFPNSFHTGSYTTDSSDKAGTPLDEEEINNFGTCFHARMFAHLGRLAKDTEPPPQQNLLSEDPCKKRSESLVEDCEYWDDFYRPYSSVSFEDDLEDCMSENSVYNKPKKIRYAKVLSEPYSKTRKLNSVSSQHIKKAKSDVGYSGSSNCVNLSFKHDISGEGFDYLQEESGNNEEKEGSVCDENDLDEREVGSWYESCTQKSHKNSLDCKSSHLKFCNKVTNSRYQLRNLTVLSKVILLY